MPADAQARVKGLKAKGLTAGGGDHLVWVDPVRMARIAHLIHVRNIDHAVAVLVQLCHLCDLGPGNWDDGVEGARVDGDNRG